MKCPKIVQVGNKEYKINTDFRVAIECNKIAEDTSISDYERALAIIYKLFGEEALDDRENHVKLLNFALKFLSCDKEVKKSEEPPDMDYEEDMDYIEASFMSDYNIDLENTEMDWWKFNKLMNGLSNSDMGNCCILNRIRNLRNYDIKDIKDKKERDKIIRAKKAVELKKYRKEDKLTKEQEKSMEELNKLLGI